MYAVSDKYKAAMKQPVQHFSMRGSIGDIYFSDENILAGSFQITNQCSDDTMIGIGQVYIGQIKIHRHIANQRLDNLHKISTKIANSYDVVCVETLNMRSMANHGFGNGKATLDNGYGMFLSMLEYKLSDRNKYLIKVDKWFPSSQICHCCGKIHPEMKNLQIRKMICDCGLTMSCDQNAAINILHEGLRLLTEVA